MAHLRSRTRSRLLPLDVKRSAYVQAFPLRSLAFNDPIVLTKVPIRPQVLKSIIDNASSQSVEKLPYVLSVLDTCTSNTLLVCMRFA